MEFYYLIGKYGAKNNKYRLFKKNNKKELVAYVKKDYLCSN